MAKFQGGDPLLPTEFDDNDFVYFDNTEEDNENNKHPELNDPRGEHTPRFAHIRKVYPRDDGVSTEPEVNDRFADIHRILRRGIPFGPPFDNSTRDIDRGLLFVCYQLDLSNQFEFLQRTWANNPNFPLKDPEATEGHGFDAIIGKHHDKGFVNLLRNGKFTKITGFKQWVTTTGGQYFFSPSISTLKKLGDLVKPSSR